MVSMRPLSQTKLESPEAAREVAAEAASVFRWGTHWGEGGHQGRGTNNLHGINSDSCRTMPPSKPRLPTQPQGAHHPAQSTASHLPQKAHCQHVFGSGTESRPTPVCLRENLQTTGTSRGQPPLDGVMLTLRLLGGNERPLKRGSCGEGHAGAGRKQNRTKQTRGAPWVSRWPIQATTAPHTRDSVVQCSVPECEVSCYG